MADGGEGTVDAFVAGGATRRVVRVAGPLGDPVDAAYALDRETAIVELAQASGLARVEAQRRDVMHSDTFGTGEVIRAALDDARRIIVGIGGSATNDVGTGMLRALGVRFLDASGRPIARPMDAYERLASIDMETIDPRLVRTVVDVASDVDNPLLGKDGAAAVFAAQKGATPEQIERLERVAQRIADMAVAAVGHDWRSEPGAGAAGGVGFALIAFLRARMQRGVELIARERGLPHLLEGATLCATGEGKIDMQTLRGKTVFGVAELARQAGVKVVAFGGRVDDDARRALEARGIDVVQTAPSEMPAKRAMADAARLLERAAYEYAVERR